MTSNKSGSWPFKTFLWTFAATALAILAQASFAMALPNLTPYHPPGWSANIVVATAPGSTGDVATDATVIRPTDTLYLNWAVVNDGATATAARFYVAVYVDGVLWNGNAHFYDDPPLQPNFFGYWHDEKYGSLPAGTHTIRIVVDSTNAVAESNEADNSYTKTIQVGDSREGRPGVKIRSVAEPSPVAVVGRGEKPVVVMDSATRNISATKGGTITLPSGSRVTFPPGLLSADQRVTVKRLSALPDEPPSGLEVSAGPALEFEITVAPSSSLSAPALFAATPSPTIGFSIALSGADLSGFEGASPLAEITLPSAGYTTYVGAQFGDVSQTQADLELPASVIYDIASALSHPGSALRIAMGVAQLPHLQRAECGYLGPLRLDTGFDPSWGKWNPIDNPCAGETVCGQHLLVLVHGILSSVENAFPTDRQCVQDLKRQGGYDQVFGFDYDYTESIAQSGAKLAKFLNDLAACCPSDNPPVIDIEAHSRGGLVTMAAVPLLNNKVRNIVLLGSPLAGTPAAVDGQVFQAILAAPGGAADVGGYCFNNDTLASLLTSPHFLADMAPGKGLRQDVIAAAAAQPKYQNLYLAAGTQGSILTGWIFDSNKPNDGAVETGSALATGLPLKPTKEGTAVFPGDNHTDLECDSDVRHWVGGKVNPENAVTVDSFTADPTTIAPGESSILSWTTTNATSVSIDSAINGLNGSMRVSPAVTTTYLLTATGPGGTATATATVTVTSGPPPPGIVFTANPTTINAGQSTTLTWATTNTTSVSINGTAEPLSGSVSVSPSATGTYTLTATGPGGTATAQVTITVIGATAPPTVSFTITPSTVAEGQSFTLTWATTNATSVSIGGTAEPLNGSVAQSLSSAGTYTYTLTAVGPGGTTTKTASVTVTSGSSGGDSVLALQFSPCQGSASPLPGWKNCPGVAKISIAYPVSSGWISVFFNYPDDNAFYHGELQIGSSTGTFLVSVINEYEASCPPSFDTIVDVYDASSSSGSGPVLVSQPFSITNHTCN